MSHKLIRGYALTPANVNDSTECESILSPNVDPSVYADPAYMSTERVEHVFGAQLQTAANGSLFPVVDEFS